MKRLCLLVFLLLLMILAPVARLRIRRIQNQKMIIQIMEIIMKRLLPMDRTGIRTAYLRRSLNRRNLKINLKSQK